MGNGVWRLRGRITELNGQALDLDLDHRVWVGRKGDPAVTEVTRPVCGEIIDDESRRPAISKTRFATGVEPYVADCTVGTRKVEAIAGSSELNNGLTGQ